ncbi:MAG: S41 family peptidase [Tannerellaceae bacterium]|jgi:carboxyl-terminal processing protease|nr:S41 family peptidase [Tannerellaceae bacterium]
MNKKLSLWLPVIIATSIALGIFIGNYFLTSGRQGKVQTYFSGNKINAILDIIENQYVDTVHIPDLIEGVIPKIFDELDPHSLYISAKDAQSLNEELEGSFSGIGVSFNMQTDTILIISVIPGGPSEKAGLLPFDRIITINDSVFAGKKTDQNEVMKNLRGTKNSIVRLGVKRRNIPDLIHFEVARGDVPVYSVDASYKVSKDIGYIKVSKFTRTTYNEFITAIARLKNESCNAFIIDLRGNTGGIMETAVNMVNEFMPQGRLIVYTEGKAFPRNDIYANGTGTCINDPIVVLTDEGSASASEIFAGAIQDNDRGLIIGRRTYGKGLVQTQVGLIDGSQLRLTIARYYTPSGRSIQKEYEMGHSETYDMDIYNRYIHGEFYSADSIKMDNLPEYQTSIGRTVFGGGGVMPDLFIPSDTSGITSYFNNVARNSNILYLYALKYSDANYDKLSSFRTYQELHAYLQQQPLLTDFTDFAAEQGVKKRPVLIDISARLIETHIQSYIVRNFFDENGFYPIFFKDDETIRRAVKVIKEGKSTPSPDNLSDKGISECMEEAGASPSPVRRYGLMKERIRENHTA